MILDERHGVVFDLIAFEPRQLNAELTQTFLRFFQCHANVDGRRCIVSAPPIDFRPPRAQLKHQ